MRFKTTAIAVVIFILVLLWASFDARADSGMRIALGRTVFNSGAMWGEVGYEFQSGWELAASVSGAGETRNGAQGEVEAVSLSRVVRPHWRLLGATNYYRLGVAYVHDSPLVGDTNYRLGIGLEWPGFQVEFFHYSSAGIHRPNTGIDGVQLRYTY